MLKTGHKPIRSTKFVERQWLCRVVMKLLITTDYTHNTAKPLPFHKECVAVLTMLYKKNGAVSCDGSGFYTVEPLHAGGLGSRLP